MAARHPAKNSSGRHQRNPTHSTIQTHTGRLARLRKNLSRPAHRLRYRAGQYPRRLPALSRLAEQNGATDSMKNQKLELTWIGKHKRPKLEARILLEDPEKSYHAKVRSESAAFDNRLIFGDNLLALKALEQEFTGKVKCIYIDPPYNTGAAFEHYDDGLEHSIWLGLIKERLDILKKLLTKNGVIFVHIDDKEMAYLKIVCDEIFGREQFLNMIVVKTSDPSGHKTVNPSPYSQTEYILMYAKDRSLYKYD